MYDNDLFNFFFFIKENKLVSCAIRTHAFFFDEIHESDFDKNGDC